MRIVIGSDHAGFVLKSALIDTFSSEHNFRDVGTHSADQSCDYPDFANLLATAMLEDTTIPFGVLICGTGIGISIAANRHRHLRAALCLNPETALVSRAHNNANVLALGARTVDEHTAKECLRTFLQCPFEGGRHIARVKKLY